MFLSLGLGRVWIGMNEMEPNALILEFVGESSDGRLVLICNGAIVKDEDKDVGFDCRMGFQFELISREILDLRRLK
jgi:hypothetical protein